MMPFLSSYRPRVNCSLSTNNVLNPFTPYGDCSLIRIANLYANIVQRSTESELTDCFDMLTHRPARARQARCRPPAV